MLTFALAYLTTAGSVGLKSLQYLNVQHRRFAFLLPTSFAMAALDYALVYIYIQNGPSIILASGLGGATGCALSMFFDSKWRKYEATKGVRDRQPSQSEGAIDCVGHP